MGKPLCVTGDMTSTSDPVVPTGFKILYSNNPVVVLGDIVSGPKCMGTVMTGASLVTVSSKPVALDGASVNGTDPSNYFAPCTPTMKGSGKDFKAS